MLIEYPSLGSTVLDLATGRQRPVSRTEEVWYEPKSGLWRDVYRIDGRTKSEQAGKCRPSPTQLPCGSDYPLSYLRPYPWPPATSGLHVAGRGSFRGHPVLWLAPPKSLRTDKKALMSVSEFGIDPRTHRIIVERFLIGRPTGGSVMVSHRPTLPSTTRFLLPAKPPVAVAPNPNFEPWAGPVFGYGLPAARESLGQPPLWLGPRFRGLVLRSVRSGVYRQYMAGPSAKPIRYVRFFYAPAGTLDFAITIDEVSSPRPWFERRGPRPGTFVRFGTTNGSLSRDGLVLRIAADPARFPLNAPNALALGRALRPLPAGLGTVSTLYEE